MSSPITPFLAVDIIILVDQKIVLIRRRNSPYQNQWALPGGFVEVGETVEEAAVREAREETGLDVELRLLVGVFSDPGRDPRGHIVSICFTAKGYGTLKAASDAQRVELFDLHNLPSLAFDHEKIIQTAQAQMEPK